MLVFRFKTSLYWHPNELPVNGERRKAGFRQIVARYVNQHESKQMEDKLYIGVGRLSLFFRQARNLKDKRSVLQGLKQKLRNEGWSVVEVGHQNEIKSAFLGLSYSSSSLSQVDRAFDKAAELLLGNFEVVRKSKEILEFETGPSIDEFNLTRAQLGDLDD